jgi:hypothetical protein
MLFHVDNNSSNSITGNQKKSVGVVRGISDLVLVCKGLVVFIEMKTEKGVQSTHQLGFERRLLERGHIYRVIRSEEEFKDFIERLYEAIKDEG